MATLRGLCGNPKIRKVKYQQSLENKGFAGILEEQTLFYYYSCFFRGNITRRVTPCSRFAPDIIKENCYRLQVVLSWKLMGKYERLR